MRAIDTNVLVYAHREDMERYPQAFRLLESLVEGNVPWAIPIFCIGEFLRVVTHQRIFDPPTPLDSALAAIQSLMSSRSLRLLLPGNLYWSILSRTLRESRVTGNRAFDAQIAALCLEHDVDTIITDDRDFRRFRGLQVVSIE